MNRAIKILPAICALLLLLFFARIAPADDRAEEAFEKNCGACHGEHGEGGIGPSLKGTGQSAGDFSAVVRSGRGMMPAITREDVSDRDIEEMYRMFAGAEKGTKAGAGGFSALSGWLLARENISGIIWGSMALMLAGFVYVSYARYSNWSGFKFGKGYFRLLGARRIARIFARTFFVDLISVSSVFRKDAKRWAIHGLLLYGFLGLVAADILISIYNPARAAMPLLSPLKMLANISGLSMALGISIVIHRMFTDPYEDNGETFLGDIAFVAALALVIVTGFAVETTRYTGLFQYTASLYLCHILFIATLFVSAPFTRFSHIVATLLLVFSTRLSEAVAASGSALGFNEEPAPGRHHKTERLAAEIVKKLRHEKVDGEIAIRYYP